MCHEPTARPPFPPIAGGQGSGEPITLRSEDGTDFAAFAARSSRPEGTGVVVMPDVRGLHPFYEDLALRFAETGSHAVAIDYFGRTAGAERRDDDFDFLPHVMKTDPDRIAEDVAAAVAHLREEFSVRSVFTVGFCFGGRSSFNQSGEGHGLDGVVGFYAGLAPYVDGDPGAPLHRAGDYETPLLGLFGGADETITADQITELDGLLQGAGIDYEIHIYPDAPHSFFDRSYEEFADECEDAWRRVLEFIETHRAD